MTEDKKLRVLSAISLTESQVERIKAVDRRIELHWYGKKDAARIPAELWRDAEILLTSGTPLPPADQTPALKWIQFYFDGVDKAYAVSAGREIRVFVKPEKVDDYSAALLAKEIAKKIELEQNYPGVVKVIVIRETRVSETAK